MNSQVAARVHSFQKEDDAGNTFFSLRRLAASKQRNTTLDKCYCPRYPYANVMGDGWVMGLVAQQKD